MKPDLVISSQNETNITALTNHPQSTTQLNTSTSFANVKPPSLFKNLPKDIKPIATKSRSFNKDDKAFIEKELQSRLKAGVIQRSDSAWRAQVLVAKDEFNRHRKRLCIDYSQTINLYTDLDAYPLPRIDKIVNELSKYKLFSTYDLKSAYHQIPLRI